WPVCLVAATGIMARASLPGPAHRQSDDSHRGQLKPICGPPIPATLMSARIPWRWNETGAGDRVTQRPVLRSIGPVFGTSCCRENVTSRRDWSRRLVAWCVGPF
ncbi:MAG: hypothetical protein AVDCRST_MAG70-19, partial [uncultured Thermomicrobiales bacterium]